jgi:hypothetical protein
LRRPPLSLLLLTLVGTILSGWMVLDGLYIRMFGQFLHHQPLLSLWLRIQSSIGSASNLEVLRMEPQDFTWPLLAMGIAWIGTLSALWLRLSWGSRLGTVVCLLSLLTLNMETILAFVALICLRASPTRSWLDAVEEPNAA